QEDEAKAKRRRARAARRRLAEAQKLKDRGPSHAFYAEVEIALTNFLSAQLGTPVAGLTRLTLAERMEAQGVTEVIRAQVLRVLEHCDVGRFAPGGADPGRHQVLDAARNVMEGWTSR